MPATAVARWPGRRHGPGHVHASDHGRGRARDPDDERGNAHSLGFILPQMSTAPVADANPSSLASPGVATRWAYVWLLLACGIGASMQVGKVPPALGLLQRDLHLGLLVSAWVISMFSVVGATLGCLAGSVVDRMGPQRAATGGLFGIAAASLAGSFAVLPWELLVSRAVEGMAFVMAVVAIPSLLVASASESDRRFVPALRTE